MKKLIFLLLTQLVVIQTFAANQLSQVEYWFDDGEKLQLNVDPMRISNIHSLVDVSSLQDGWHQLKIRVKQSGSNGDIWSQEQIQPLWVNHQHPPTIDYQINGVAFSVEPDSSFFRFNSIIDKQQLVSGDNPFVVSFNDGAVAQEFDQMVWLNSAQDNSITYSINGAQTDVAFDQTLVRFNPLLELNELSLGENSLMVSYKDGGLETSVSSLVQHVGESPYSYNVNVAGELKLSSTMTSGFAHIDELINVSDVTQGRHLTSVEILGDGQVLSQQQQLVQHYPLTAANAVSTFTYQSGNNNPVELSFENPSALTIFEAPMSDIALGEHGLSVFITDSTEKQSVAFGAIIDFNDFDGDNIADHVDTDRDGDNVENDVDRFPDNPDEWADNDNDGLGDRFEDDDDDNDGHKDEDDAFPLDDSEWLDSDGDGIGDNTDETPFPRSIVSIEQASYEVNEDVGTLSIMLTRTHADIALTVDAHLFDGLPEMVEDELVNGDASVGDDYQNYAQTITFDAGMDTYSIDVMINDNDVFESTEAFTLILDNVLVTGEGEAQLAEVNYAWVRIIDNDVAPPTGAFGFSQNTRQINESIGTITVSVIREGGSIGDISVDYLTVSDSALPESDFVATNGTLFFADSELIKTFDVEIINDNIFETVESFSIKLENLSSGSLLENSSLTVEILNDDVLPEKGAIEFAQDHYIVNENDYEFRAKLIRHPSFDFETTVTMLLLKTGDAGYGDVVFPQLLNDSAYHFTIAEGVDHYFASGFMIDDDVYEGDETFSLYLANNTGDGTPIGERNTAIVTIRDDEEPPASGVFKFSSDEVEFNESDGIASFTILRTNNSEGEVTVSLSIENDENLSSDDYIVPELDIIFADGETEKQIDIELIDDQWPEVDESLTVTIDSVTADAFYKESAQIRVTILNDDEEPTFSLIEFSHSSADYSESVEDHRIILTRKHGLDYEASITVTSTNGTAIKGEDFIFDDQMVTFKSGERIAYADLKLVRDELVEDTEYAIFSLINLGDHQLDKDSELRVRIIDNDDDPIVNPGPEPETPKNKSQFGISLFLLLLILFRRKMFR